MEGFFGLLALALILAAFIGAGRWVVMPIDRAAKIRNAPRRFSIGDFLCLFLAVQVPLTAIHLLIRAEERRMFWGFSIATWIAAPVIWYVCTQALSRAGINQGVYRAVFLGLVLPVVYYGLFPFVLLPFVILSAIVSRDAVMLSLLDTFVSSWVIITVLLWLSGLYTRWLVRRLDHELTAAVAGEAVVGRDASMRTDPVIAVT
jgi:hypothetical protein